MGRERVDLIHREILQLCLLIATAIAAFFLTRAVAASNHNLSLRDGSEWYERGQQALHTDRVDDAIDSFRRAAVRNRGERRYMLALARALERKGDTEAARASLSALRESAPEDAEINLELARLAVQRRDATEALRFYHSALYAPWPLEQTAARRQVRFELIQFLLTDHQTSRALSELLALNSDLPDDVAIHVKVARLFAQAGDDRHALDQYEIALHIAPDNGDSLVGAGLAAFQLGEYALARTYLRHASGRDPNIRSTSELVDLILTNDPLASRIGANARAHRLVSGFSYAEQRLNRCLEQRARGEASQEEVELQREARMFEAALRPSAVRDQDTVESGVELVARIERHVAQACPPETPLDRALILIGRLHGADGR